MQVVAVHNTDDIVHWHRQYPDSKVHGARMGSIWGPQDPGGPHVGPMNYVIWVSLKIYWWLCCALFLAIHSLLL